MISTVYPEQSQIHDSSDEHAYVNTTSKEGDLVNWEILSDSNSDQDSPISKEIVIDALIHRCKSLPNFSIRNIPSSQHNEEDTDDDEFSEIDSSFDVRSLQTEEIQSSTSSHVSLSSPIKRSNDDWSMISPTHTGAFRKIPSFKDMLLKNTGSGDAATTTSKQDQARIELQEKLKKSIKSITPTFIVSNDRVHPTRLKRCGFSTGDLSTTLHPSRQESNPCIIPEDEEEEVLGESDAVEFYHQKSHGKSSHVKGLKLRPDEAKRKEYSLNKKRNA